MKQHQYILGGMPVDYDTVTWWMVTKVSDAPASDWIDTFIRDLYNN
jgi:hypothetical protein